MAKTKKPTSWTTKGIPKDKRLTPVTVAELKRNRMITWDEIDKVLETEGAAPRVLLFGPPGLGKSFAGCERKGARKTYTITVTPDMSAAQLLGHFIPQGDRFVWMDGPAIAAWREGGRLVLNEIDQASADVLTLLHVVLDDPEFARLTLPNETHEEIRPATGFSVVATTNADDPKACLPEALYDRFPVQIKVETPHPKAIAALPEDLRKAAGETAVLVGERRVGLRAWQAFARLRERLKDESLAARLVFQKRAKDVMDALLLARSAK